MILENLYYELTAIHNLLGDDGIRPLLQEYGSGENKRIAISKRKMVDLLGVEDWEKLKDIFFQLKKEQVQTLVDIFRNPEKHQTRDDNKAETIRDIFIGQIQKRGNYM